MKPKRLILSRKGFDSGKKSGKGPSPIFPDDTMFSLPIPEPHQQNSKVAYQDLQHVSRNFGTIRVGKLLADLTDKHSPSTRAHFDPHLNLTVCPNLVNPKDAGNWRGLLGQEGAAQGHLRNQGVCKGDLFLFFGLYQRVKDVNGHWRFDDSEPRHVLWGWLQVGDKYDLTSTAERQRVPAWARYHQHMQESYRRDVNNTLYVASEELDLGDGPIAGAGVFPKFDKRLVLTEPGKSATYWRLPKQFHPGGRTPLTYYGKRKWELKGDYTYVQRSGYGQEFVLQVEEYPGALNWVSTLVNIANQR